MLKIAAALVAALVTLATLTPAPAEAIGPNAVLTEAGCYTTAMHRNDDHWVQDVAVGFELNFYGRRVNRVHVNNNGNITLDQPLGTYTPFPLLNTARQIIAPFFADVDTRHSASDVTRWGSITYKGRPALCVSWAGVGVGYYNYRVDKLNNFQLVLVDRSDIAPGDFDMIFNYDRVLWEAGEASGGRNGLGGYPVRVGWSNGVNASFELTGSGVAGALLDSNTRTGLIHNSLNSGGQLGRYVFSVRSGAVQPPTATPPTITVPANIVAEATGPAGAVVTYTVTARDGQGVALTPSCSPASESAFPLGITTVRCTARDARGAEATGSFTVTVRDTTPPSITAPSSVVAEATSAAGATVHYTVTASDLVDPNPVLVCTPPSGGTFALGTTTVECSARDAAGNLSTATFPVTVRDTTPPVARCDDGVNPDGRKPNAAAGFRLAWATDAVGVVSLTFTSGTFSWTFDGSSVNVKLTKAPGETGMVEPGAGQVHRHLIGPGDWTVTARDAAGNAATVSCRMRQ